MCVSWLCSGAAQQAKRQQCINALKVVPVKNISKHLHILKIIYTRQIKNEKHVINLKKAIDKKNNPDLDFVEVANRRGSPVSTRALSCFLWLLFTPEGADETFSVTLCLF